MGRTVQYMHNHLYRKPIANLTKSHFQRICKRKLVTEVANYPMKHDDNFENEKMEEVFSSKIYEGLDLRKFLKMFFTAFNLSHHAGDILMQYLSENFNVKLPKSTKTLLQTPNELEITEIQPKGFYAHYGILRNIINFKKFPENVDTLSFQFFIDGLEVKNENNNFKNLNLNSSIIYRVNIDQKKLCG